MRERDAVQTRTGAAKNTTQPKLGIACGSRDAGTAIRPVILISPVCPSAAKGKMWYNRCVKPITTSVYTFSNLVGGDDGARPHRRRRRDGEVRLRLRVQDSGTSEEALAQIDGKGYAADPRKLVKIGCAFDWDARNLGKWLVG